MRRRGGWRRVLRRAFVPLLVLVLALVWAMRAGPLAPPPPVEEVDLTFGLCGEGWGGCVVDGDTVRIGKRRIRLTGFDAPELDGACDAEREKAREAREALLTWLAEGPFEWTADADTPYDQYGRELREARRGDQLLADYMIEAGLAEGSGWGAVRRDWCAP